MSGARRVGDWSLVVIGGVCANEWRACTVQGVVPDIVTLGKVTHTRAAARLSGEREGYEKESERGREKS